MVGVEQETKVMSGRRREDWGGEENEGRVVFFRELDRSVNKHEFSLGWVKREKVRRYPVGNVREERLWQCSNSALSLSSVPLLV
jgi:hypothetical protein